MVVPLSISWYFSSWWFWIRWCLIFGMLGLPELLAMPIILIGALTTNFFVFRWSVNKLNAAS